jgi:uncharacterized membrane protein (UPF0127 family)
MFLIIIFFQFEKIKINQSYLTVEIADDDEKRMRGLMFRNYMPDSLGMLFIFDSSGIYPFWMRNTYIPLSIAFIDESFRILEIVDMKPLDETPIYPFRRFKYALEVNQGWFKKRSIRVGDKVEFLNSNH